MRKPIVGMSLKNYINKNHETKLLVSQLTTLCGDETSVEQFLFPSLGTIFSTKEALLQSKIGFGAQNIAPEKNGAFTGEFSIESLIDLGGKYVEIGHEERKKLFFESDDLINKKIILSLNNLLYPVVCIGEGDKKLDQENRYFKIKNQIVAIFKNIPDDRLTNLILAYEPGWAIGKAKAASPKYIHSSHMIIRKIIADLYGKDIANKIRIIYGGSVSKLNTTEIVNCKDVDGVFLGRFGHKPSDYFEILQMVKKIKLDQK